MHGPHQCHAAGDSDCAWCCHPDCGGSRVLLDRGGFGLYPDQEGPGFIQPLAAARGHLRLDRGSQLPGPPDVGSPQPGCAGVKLNHMGIKHPPCGGRSPRSPLLLLLLFPSGPCPGHLDRVISTPTQDSMGMMPPKPHPRGLLGCKGEVHTSCPVGCHPVAPIPCGTRASSHSAKGLGPPAPPQRWAWGQGAAGTGVPPPRHPTLCGEGKGGKQGGSMTACQKNAQLAWPPRPLCPRAMAAC